MTLNTSFLLVTAWLADAAQTQPQTAPAGTGAGTQLPETGVLIACITIGLLAAWALVNWLKRTHPPEGLPPLGPRRPYLANITVRRAEDGSPQRPLVPEDDKPEDAPQWGVMEFAFGFAALFILSGMAVSRTSGSLSARLQVQAMVGMVVFVGLLAFLKVVYQQNPLRLLFPAATFRGIWKHLLVIPPLGFLTVALGFGLLWQLVLHAAQVHLPRQSLVQVLIDTPLSETAFWTWAVISSAVVAPLIEELLFRGILYVGMRKLVGVHGAAVGSALVFALIHMSVSAFPPLLLLGVLLAYSFERTRNLLVPIVFHVVFNAINLAMMAAGMGA